MFFRWNVKSFNVLLPLHVHVFIIFLKLLWKGLINWLFEIPFDLGGCLFVFTNRNLHFYIKYHI
jgi:hypothetical protein